MRAAKGLKVEEIERRPEPAGEAVDVSIEKMVYGGEGLARTSEGVLLAPLVLPGERVSVLPDERHKGIRRSQLLQVLEPSPDRISPACSYFSRCGGCQYQHIRYERQLEIKREILIECFERIGKIRLEVPVSILSAEPWNYRNRVRLRIEKRGARFEIGYFELLSHRLCPIESCPISAPAISDAIGKLAAGAGARCFPEGDAELEIFASDSGQTLLATIYSEGPALKGFGDALRNELPELESVCWRHEPSRPARGQASARETVWGSGAVVVHVGDFHFRVGHNSFFQANRFLLQGLMDAAMGDLRGDRALDLYAGVGFFTLPLARRFEKVSAVEAGAASARDLESNVGVAGLRVRAYCSDAEKFLAKATPEWDAIVVDPPRAGLSKPVVDRLCQLRAPRVVYVSCDPTTLARDVAALMKGGYRTRSVHLVDQFPQTFHLEVVVHLERRE